MKLRNLFLIGCLGLGLSASANDRSFGEIYTQCGLGGLIASDAPVIAVITNITWDLGTTAISSNVSSDGTCAKKSAKVASFINTSYDKLEKELAQGEGEYLDSLVSMTKPADTTKEAYVASIRADFSKVVASNASAYDKKEALYNIVM